MEAVLANVEGEQEKVMEAAVKVAGKYQGFAWFFQNAKGIDHGHKVPLGFCALFHMHKSLPGIQAISSFAFHQPHGHPIPPGRAPPCALNEYAHLMHPLNHLLDQSFAWCSAIEDIADQNLNTKKMVLKFWQYGSKSFHPLYEDGEFEDLAEYIVKKESKEEEELMEIGQDQPLHLFLSVRLILPGYVLRCPLSFWPPLHS